MYQLHRNQVGREVKNERGLLNFVCTVFEQGDEMLTLSSMEKQ